MTKSRQRLHELLLDVMKREYEERRSADPSTADFSNHVYFQAPTRIAYPAIVYERAPSDTQFADNAPYIYEHRYQITVIDPDADSGIPDKVAHLPRCIHDRYFVSENLHHDVFMIYC